MADQLKDGWVSITYPGKKTKVVKQASKAHVDAMGVGRLDGVGRPQVVKLASRGALLTQAVKARGVPANAPTVKAQAKGEDKAQAQGDDK